ncbi:MAG: acetyl-CoA carboxylase, carboxyltransferase subunit beta [Alphaproteobacteria bacterium]|nr:acetyl-CoA carboxylase, carboxyltransferase subunit beta [Alphaproteobacteria bacterium]
MNWLTDFIRPRIRSLVEPREVPDNLWQKCPKCEGMLFHRDLEKNLNVCYHCNYHLRISVKERLDFLFDEARYSRLALPEVAFDPLKFKDRKRYSERLRETKAKTGLKDAITAAKGMIGGNPAVVAAFNFSFMGGSMGAAVGEAILTAAQEAVRTRSAFIIIPSSGGARMQEGMLSLIQMPRTIIAVEMVKEAGLPYIVLLTDPTTGGVSASFAMVGDIHLAEPGSTIGFAGRRVIEETVREKLPDDFQTAEYLRDKGMVDMVVSRRDIPQTIGTILNLLMNPEAPSPSGDLEGAEMGRRAAGSSRSDAGKSRAAKNAARQARSALSAAKKSDKKPAKKPLKKTARSAV